jgi:hypothetical protein
MVECRLRVGSGATSRHTVGVKQLRFSHKAQRGAPMTKCLVMLLHWTHGTSRHDVTLQNVPLFTNQSQSVGAPRGQGMSTAAAPSSSVQSSSDAVSTPRLYHAAASVISDHSPLISDPTGFCLYSSAAAADPPRSPLTILPSP